MKKVLGIAMVVSMVACFGADANAAPVKKLSPELQRQLDANNAKSKKFEPANAEEAFNGPPAAAGKKKTDGMTKAQIKAAADKAEARKDAREEDRKSVV